MICFSCTELDRQELARAKVDPAKLKATPRDYSQEPVQKPWGEEREIRLTDEFSMWRLAINFGHETSMHCHTIKTCLMEVQSGEAILTTFQGDRILRQGDCVLIERGVFHRIKTPGGAVVIELEWPPNRNDLVRLSDKYGRQGRGYED